MGEVEPLYEYVLTCKNCRSQAWFICLDGMDKNEASPVKVECIECGLIAYDFRDETPETENA